jgi:carbonic anhydrase
MHLTRSVFSALTFTLVLVTACTSQNPPQKTSEVKVSEAPKKAVTLYEAQDQWPGACQRGKENDQRQSPIALKDAQFKNAKSSALGFAYKPGDVEVMDNGHTLVYRFKGDAGHLVFEGQKYLLKQFHFHKASEHTLNGQSYAMEVHFVHLAAPGSARKGAVALGFFLEPGASSPAWKKLWSGLPAAAPASPHGAEHSEHTLTQLAQVDARALIPKQGRYYAYEGSLTTPSCDEIVTHVVAVKPLPLDQASIDLFAGYHPLSNRQLQAEGQPGIRKYRLAFEK